MGHDFINAETEYRIQRLSTTNKSGSDNGGRLRKAALTIALFSILVAACGTAAADVSGQSAGLGVVVADDATTSVAPRIVEAVTDQEPWGLPDYSAWQTTTGDQYAEPAFGPR